MNRSYKILLFSTLLMNASAMLTMERAVARAQDEALIEQLSQAVQEKDFDRYFALLDEQPLEQQKQLIHANLLNAERKIQKAIHFAAEQGNMAAVKKLLGMGASINATENEDGMTALLYAAKRGDLEMVALLLEKGADKTTTAEGGMTALHLVAARNNVRAIITLVKQHGFYVDSDPSYDADQLSCLRFHTPLHIAAEHGHVAAIDTLIELGAQKDSTNIHAYNALHIAAGAGKTAAVVALIVKHGFDPNELCARGKTALHHAVGENGTCETVKALIANGAKTDCKDKEGWTALHHAALANKPAIIALLIKEYGLDPNRETKTGETPLGLTRIRRACLAELTLLCAGARGKECEKPVNETFFCLKDLTPKSASPIMLGALLKGSLEPWDPNVVEDFHDRATPLIPASLLCCIYDQATPLIKAAKYGCLPCLTFLLKDPRTNTNAQGGKQKTALHHVIQERYVQSPEMCARLLNVRRTNISLKDEDDNTARQLLNKIMEEKEAFDPTLQKLSRLFDLRKMHVQSYLSLKNARCSQQCSEKVCSHLPQLPADICFKIVGMLTVESVP